MIPVRGGASWTAEEDAQLEDIAARFRAERMLSLRERRDRAAREAATALGRSPAACFNRLRRLDMRKS